METASRASTERVLVAMKVLAWIVFIGLMIKSGAVQFGYVLSLFNQEAAKSFYLGEGMYALRLNDMFHYTVASLFMAALPAMQAYIAYLVIRVLDQVNLLQPFTISVARKMESMSYDLVAIWAVSVVQTAHRAWWAKVDPSPDWGGGETLFMAGLVFVISQVFKRGVEIQSENDLTV